MSARILAPAWKVALPSLIPPELRCLAQWIAWWSVAGEGVPVTLPGGGTTRPLKEQKKPHKLPVDPRTGGLAATTRAKTWSSFQDACIALEKWKLSGIGFVFTQSDSLSGVDLDDCRNAATGEIADWAKKIIRALDSYTEASPSGTGVHTILRGELPAGQGNQITHHGGKVEMFSRDRYFTVTGNLIDGAPVEIRDRHAELLALHSDLFACRRSGGRLGTRRPLPTLLDTDTELIARARRAQNGARFERLWNGQWRGEYPSQSEADLALCCMLTFWAGHDPARVKSLFIQSGLVREKWQNHSYANRTISAAIAVTAETYQPQRRLTPVLNEHSNHGATGETCSARDLLHFPYTDTGNAERLVCLYGDDLRFCPEIKKWLVWDGRRWNSSDTRSVKRLFKKTIREMHRQAVDIPDQTTREIAEKHARKSESASMISTALTCAEYEEGIATSANLLDRDPFLLNCKNGTLNLRTRRLQQHDRGDLITRLVDVNYRQDATCPLFLRFLHRIMDANCDAATLGRAKRLVAYLQKCFGYALTGDVSEKAVFCFFGNGNNGKTTLLEIVRFILTEYSSQILIDSLMAHQSRESNLSVADLADLRGARFVTTSEAEEGQKLAVGKLKYLTQGMGEIKSCRKYENPITFMATHKFFLDANHKPVVRGVEKAVWNRLKPIPFLVTIPPGEIDKSLLQKLKGEAEGILAWLVEGCRIWQKEGLGDPPEVIEASTRWQAESDRFRTFIDERYVIDSDGWIPASEPWSAYGEWCQSNRETNRLTKSALIAKLQELRCRQGVRNSGKVRVWIGIRRRDPEDDFVPVSDKVTSGDTNL